MEVKLYLDSSFVFSYSAVMGKKTTYNTRMDEDLIKQFKILAIKLGKRQNEVLEEAIRDLLKKYDKKFSEK